MSVSRNSPRTEDVEQTAEEIRDVARPLSYAALDELVEEIGDSRFVLLGEASHGTAEFYQLRARLTAKLIRERDFSFVAVEGDWTDCYEINRYVGGDRDDIDDVLRAFDRWPTWMWANWEVHEFATWLRDYNADRADPVGFYGMDVYSLFESMEAVIDYLESVDPEAASRARDAYHCFSPYGEDAQNYARSTRLSPESCEGQVVQILSELRERAGEYSGRDAGSYFGAEQNALVAKNAEEYYRAMVSADTESWNVRDEHMAETIDRLVEHHDGGKAIVWAHNTHVGDARETDMKNRGRLNIGQLARERHDDDGVSLVGFGTHRGEVIAGSEWSSPRQTMRVPPAREGSYGDAFHRSGVGDSLVLSTDVPDDGALRNERGQRAIGVVYDPDSEWGNYVPTDLPGRYDAFLHVEETNALHPMRGEVATRGPPEAYPWGL